MARARAKMLLKAEKVVWPPVPLEKIAENLNIDIHYHMTPELDTSFSFKMGGQYKICIYISGEYEIDRWSIAHELGHILLGHFDLYPIDTLNCNRLNDYETNILESEAEIFAEELLMPKEWLARNKKLGIMDLHRIFGVPAEFLSARVLSTGV